MNKTGIHLLIFLFLFNDPSAKADELADSLLLAVKNKFNLVKEYEAKVTIKVDVDFIKIPVKQGTIWFMQPDKVEVDTKGFSLLPKRGMDFSPALLFSGNHTALYVKKDELNGIPVHVIKVIPTGEDSEIIISTLWVDGDRKIIRKVEATTRNEGTFVMNFIYPDAVKEYDLPDRIVFLFDIRKNELPMGITGDFETSAITDDGKKSTKGKVIINYLEYIVNEGKAIPVFEKKRKK